MHVVSQAGKQAGKQAGGQAGGQAAEFSMSAPVREAGRAAADDDCGVCLSEQNAECHLCL